MIVDVLKRYLLIVWNFFFGQVSSESIQDSPSSTAKPDPVTDQADLNLCTEERSDGNDESDDDDDVEVVFDDEDREEDEDEEDVVEDEDDEEISPKKPEGKNVVPAAKPDQKTVVVKEPEEPKVPEVPEAKGGLKKPELPKAASDVKVPEKPKVEYEKKDDVPESKPEFVPVAPERKGDSPRPKPDFEADERQASVPVAPERKGDAPKPKPEAPKPPKPAEEVASQPPAAAVQDDVKAPERAKAHVKFEDEKDEVRIPPPKVPEPAALADPNARFVSSEKGDANDPAARNVAGGPKQQHPTTIDAFLSGEQRHAAVQDHPPPANPQRPESIQDQTLEYSDSGEELSDDDIEIDYEDDDDDEDVEEVKPLPPVARTVYKKND